MKRIENRDLVNKRLFLLDIDGTIAFDAALIDGASSFFQAVRRLGGEYVFITNNSTKSRKDYVDKFTGMGVDVTEDSFLTSSYATALFIKEKYGDECVHVVGTRSFLRELREFGVRATEQKEADVRAVVVGFDDELTYEKVRTACDILYTMDVDYLATNPDLKCPTGFGFIPDCGAICAMIGHATGREPLYVGKPNPLVVEMAKKRTGFGSEQTLVVGDRLYTDIACGNRAGVDTSKVKKTFPRFTPRTSRKYTGSWWAREEAF